MSLRTKLKERKHRVGVDRLTARILSLSTPELLELFDQSLNRVIQFFPAYRTSRDAAYLEEMRVNNRAIAIIIAELAARQEEISGQQTRQVEVPRGR